MKCSIVILACVLSAAYCMHLTAEQKARLQRHHEICGKEIKIDKKVISDAKSGKFSEGQELKDYVFCILKRSNLVDNKGVLKEEVLMAKLPKDTNMLAARVITELCKSQEGANPAERAYRMYRCYYEATPSHVSLI